MAFLRMSASFSRQTGQAFMRMVRFVENNRAVRHQVDKLLRAMPPLERAISRAIARNEGAGGRRGEETDGGGWRVPRDSDQRREWRELIADRLGGAAPGVRD
jgi:hypothetical protein